MQQSEVNSSVYPTHEKSYTPNEVAVGQVAAALMGKVSPEALAVGIALAGFVPFDFHRLTAWPTWDTLKKLTVIGGRDRINRALKELEDGGHIRKRPRSRGESCIWILTCLADHYPDAARGFMRAATTLSDAPAGDYKIGFGPVGMSPESGFPSPETGLDPSPESGLQQDLNHNQISKEEREEAPRARTTPKSGGLYI